MNKWRIEENGNYYCIRSSYDAKCLNYSNNDLFVNDCNNNKFEQIIIKNNKICSIYNECLENKYTIKTTAIVSPKYEHLICSSSYIKAGYNYCSDYNTPVEYVDELVNWGIENGKLCGIGYERCSWNAIGYPCCFSVNPKVVYTDKNGDWGFEDDQWCGIGEVVTNNKYRIRNKKNQRCLILDRGDSNKIRLGDYEDNENNVWYIKDNEIISAANNKCLYAINSIDPGLENCNDIYKHVDYYKFFNIIINNKYVCVKNNVEPKRYC